MLPKTITCFCKIDELKKTNQLLHFGRTFGCCYGKKIELLDTVREKCPYNAFMFGRNYFASLGCSSLSVSKEMICAFCCHPKEHLNYHVKKVCIKVSHKNDLQFQVIPFKKYLYEKTSSFFCFRRAT